MLTKVCTTCEAEKSVDDYYQQKRGKHGVKAVCKSCCKQYREQYHQANRDVILEQLRVYRDTNKESRTNYRRAYYAANKEAESVYDKAYYQANKESIAEKNKTYYLANKEAIAAHRQANKEAIAQWHSNARKANPHLYNAYTAKRRASKKNATPAWADLETIKGMYQLATIFNRTGMNLHVDHVIPLQSNFVCGLHCEANLQLMPASDNQSKGNRQWPDMPQT